MTARNNTVSVIIPCYKQSSYLEDSIESVVQQTYKDIEIIIIDEGGNNNLELKHAISSKNREIKILKTNKIGLANARNEGIREAKGEYILPLDADDKIGHLYVEKAVDILKSKNEVGIVYSKASFFGYRSGPWELPPYHFPDILLSPRIFCSAMFRKKEWKLVGGYCSKFYYGWEDHDLWLSIIGLGRNVVRLEECFFFYRKHKNKSMTDDLNSNREKYLYTIRLLVERHKKLFLGNLDHVITEYCNKHTSEYRLMHDF